MTLVKSDRQFAVASTASIGERHFMILFFTRVLPIMIRQQRTYISILIVRLV